MEPPPTRQASPMNVSSLTIGREEERQKLWSSNRRRGRQWMGVSRMCLGSEHVEKGRRDAHGKNQRRDLGWAEESEGVQPCRKPRRRTGVFGGIVFSFVAMLGLTDEVSCSFRSSKALLSFVALGGSILCSTAATADGQKTGPREIPFLWEEDLGAPENELLGGWLEQTPDPLYHEQHLQQQRLAPQETNHFHRYLGHAGPEQLLAGAPETMGLTGVLKSSLFSRDEVDTDAAGGIVVGDSGVDDAGNGTEETTSNSPPSIEWNSSAYDYFQKLRYIRSSGAKAITPNVTLVDGFDDVTGTNRTFRLHHMSIFHAFEGESSFGLWISSAASAVLALHHFNNRIGDVTPQMAANSTAGLCPDLRFTVEFFDTQYSPIAAAGNFSSVVRPRSEKKDPTAPYPTILGGSIRSAVTSPLAILSGIYTVPQISMSATSSALDNKELYPFFGRVIPTNVGDSQAAISYFVNKLNVTHFGLLYVRDDYGTAFAKAMLQEVVNYEKVVVQVASFDFFAEDEQLRVAVKQLAEPRYRYYFAIIFEEHYDKVMSFAEEEGIVGKDHFWMFTDSLADISAFKFNLNQTGSISGTTGAALVTTATPEALKKSKKKLAGRKAYEDQWTNLVQVDPDFRSYFESVLPPHVQERESLRKFQFRDEVELRSLNYFGYESVVAMALATCRAYAQAAERESRSTTSNVEISGSALKDNETLAVSFTSQEVYEQFLNSSFSGLYGTVVVDKFGSRETSTVPFSISNVRWAGVNDEGKAVFEGVTTDLYEPLDDNSDPWIKLADFIFSDRSTVAHPDLAPVNFNFNKLNPWTKGYGYFLCISSLLLSLYFASWAWLYRSSKVIKASQPVFLVTICVGTFIMSLLIIPLSFEDPMQTWVLNVSCMSTVWLGSVGFVFAFSALFAKTRRINLIFRQRRFTRVAVSANDVMKPFFALLMVNALVLTLCTIFTPLQFDRKDGGQLDQYNRVISSYAVCQPSDDKFERAVILLGVLAFVDFGILLYACFQAYEARTITIEYSESKYIGLSLISMAQIVLLGVPILITAQEYPNTRFFVISSITSFTSFAILIPIFVPKVYFHRKWLEEKKEKEAKRKKRHEERVRHALKLEEDEEVNSQDLKLSTPATLESSEGDIVGLKVVVDPMKEESRLSAKMRLELARMKRENLLLKKRSEAFRNRLHVLRQESARELTTRSYSLFGGEDEREIISEVVNEEEEGEGSESDFRPTFSSNGMAPPNFRMAVSSTI